MEKEKVYLTTLTDVDPTDVKIGNYRVKILPNVNRRLQSIFIHNL